MDAIELLRLKQLRFEAASQLVLKEWKSEDLSKQKCPDCFAQAFLTPYQSQGKQVYHCIRCNYYFKQVLPARICECTLPGQHKVCRGCPNFNRFMELVNQQLPKLENLTIEALQSFISSQANTISRTWE